MATNLKISTQIENQLPDFVRDEGPNLVAFLKAYYEWMETNQQATDAMKNLIVNQDIDTALSNYIEYFRREIIPSFPQEMRADKQFVMKRIKDLYRSRGAEQSYKLLFRILYNEEIEIYNPSEQILKASDGRWVTETSIRLGDPATGNTFALLGQSITGVSSGATAKIERITQTSESGLLVKESFLSNIAGTFRDGEVVRDSANTITATIYNISGPLTGITFNDAAEPGVGHQQGDSVTISGAGSTRDATGTISSIDNASGIRIAVVSGGTGYRVTPASGDASLGGVVNLSGGSGVDARFYISSISNTSTVSLSNNDIRPIANVVLSTGPTFVSLGTNTSPLSSNLAGANISSTIASALNFNDTTVGSINTISVTNFGKRYAAKPTATAIDQEVAELAIPDPGGIRGQNAVLRVDYEPGAIASINIQDSGQAFNKYRLATITNNTRSPTNATEPKEFGSGFPGTTSGYNTTGFGSTFGIFQYDGKYIDTKGFLSGDMRLQDNFYYQDFSYQIESDNFIRKYRKFVNDILHPAGTKMFGHVRLQSTISAAITVSSNVQTANSTTRTFDTTENTFDSSLITFDKG